MFGQGYEICGLGAAAQEANAPQKGRRKEIAFLPVGTKVAAFGGDE
jgi:hypothetical protein